MSVAGNWQLVIESPIGKQNVTVLMEENDGVLSGTLKNNGNGLVTDIFDGTVTGDELQWKVTLKQMKMTLTFNTSVNQNSMSGKVKAGMFGRFNVHGERVV